MRRAFLACVLLLLACGRIDHRAEGLQLYQQGRYAEAEAHLKKVKDDKLLGPLAECLYQQKKLAEAAPVYEQYLQKNPQPDPALVAHYAEMLPALARAASQAGRGEEAITTLKRLATLQPGNPELKDPAAALRESAKLMPQDPRMAFYHASRARTVRPDNRQAMNLQISAASQFMDLNEVRKLCATVPPDALSAGTRASLANAYVARVKGQTSSPNEYELNQRLDLLNQALALAPRLPEAYFQRARLRYRRRYQDGGRYQASIPLATVMADLQQARKLGGGPLVARALSQVGFDQSLEARLASLSRTAQSGPAPTGNPPGTYDTQFYVLARPSTGHVVLVDKSGAYVRVPEEKTASLQVGHWYYGDSGGGGPSLLLDGWEKRRPAVSSSPIMQRVKNPSGGGYSTRPNGTWHWNPYTQVGRGEKLTPVLVVKDGQGLMLVTPGADFEGPSNFRDVDRRLAKIAARPGLELFVTDQGEFLGGDFEKKYAPGAKAENE